MYTVSKKTVQICFFQNVVKLSPILIILLQKDDKEAKITRDALTFHLT